MSFELGQSYTTSVPNTGVQRCPYTSSALTSLSLPLRTKSLPFGPKHTVTFLPSNTNVKVSPYCRTDQVCFIKLVQRPYLSSILEEELIWINAVGNCAAYDWEPVED